MEGMIRNRLDALARDKGTTVAGIAEALGKHPTTLYRFARGSDERKTTRLDLLNEICELLDVQPGDIFVWVPNGSNGDKQ